MKYYWTYIETRKGVTYYKHLIIEGKIIGRDQEDDQDYHRYVKKMISDAGFTKSQRNKETNW